MNRSRIRNSINTRPLFCHGLTTLNRRYLKGQAPGEIHFYFLKLLKMLQYVESFYPMEGVDGDEAISHPIISSSSPKKRKCPVEPIMDDTFFVIE